MYEIHAGFEPNLDCIGKYETKEEAMVAFNTLSPGPKYKWFTEANCGSRIPNDYLVCVFECLLDSDGEFLDYEELTYTKYGIDEMVAEYGSTDNAPFGLSAKSMKKLGW